MKIDIILGVSALGTLESQLAVVCTVRKVKKRTETETSFDAMNKFFFRLKEYRKTKRTNSNIAYNSYAMYTSCSYDFGVNSSM